MREKIIEILEDGYMHPNEVTVCFTNEEHEYLLQFLSDHPEPEEMGEVCNCESIETTDVSKRDKGYYHVLCNKPISHPLVDDQRLDKPKQMIRDQMSAEEWLKQSDYANLINQSMNGHNLAYILTQFFQHHTTPQPSNSKEIT